MAAQHTPPGPPHEKAWFQPQRLTLCAQQATKMRERASAGGQRRPVAPAGAGGASQGHTTAIRAPQTRNASLDKRRTCLVTCHNARPKSAGTAPSCAARRTCLPWMPSCACGSSCLRQIAPPQRRSVARWDACPSRAQRRKTSTTASPSRQKLAATRGERWRSVLRLGSCKTPDWRGGAVQWKASECGITSTNQLFSRC